MSTQVKTLAQILGFGLTVASVTTSIILWSTSHFQSKEDAKNFKSDVEKQFNNVTAELQTIRSSNNQISIDVSYIRGRLEPQIQTPRK